MIVYSLIRRIRARRTARAQQPSPKARTTRGAGDNAATLVLHQARFDLLAFVRNRQARFFTLLLPLVFLCIFVSVFGNDSVGPDHVKASTYYVPGLAALAVIASSFVNLVITVTTERESGVLKRRRATPVPAWVLVAGRTVTAMATSLAVMTVLIVAGVVLFGVSVDVAAIPAIALTAVVGSVAFCVLGYAVAGVIDSADAAQPVVQAIMLPLYFVSGVFIPNVNLPSWMQSVATLFPVQHLAAALRTAFDPVAHGTGIIVTDLAVLAAWGIAGLAVALRRFRWMPVVATA